MVTLREKIRDLKAKRDRMKTLQLMKEEEIRSNYVGDYYTDTLSMMKSSVGKLVIITPEQCCIEDAPNGIPHKKAAQRVLENIKREPISIDNLSEADFGFSLSKQFNYIVIRMVPVTVGYSTICLPEEVTSFQLQRLKEFNKYVKEFNSFNKYPVELRISYSNPEMEYEDLEAEINNLESHQNDSLETDDIIFYENNSSVTNYNNK